MMSLKSKALLVKAVDDPIPGIPRPGPYQRYRYPRLEIVTRRMKVVQPGHVRLKVILAGVCGTDIHLLESNKSTGYVNCSAPASIPRKGRILGHECVGQIIEVGEAVTGLQPGDIVACESIISCGVCIPCRQGAFNQCSRARLLGMEEDGIFATYADLPQRICHPIEGLEQKPQGLVQAACLEPAAVAYVAFEYARVQSAEHVLIFGGGPIGLFLAMLAKCIFGSLWVELIEPLKLRRELANRWADQVFTPRQFWARKTAALPYYDAVFEASGEL
ncbi:MAG: alcohol dehydrogenase catalytic domain-containing protein, partial [Candidatus Omnitrophica bacterium]|nr:alcohol dehydrogenase catalytic domain-containing protein [Candidatus Omnitrophota bacterium]